MSSSSPESAASAQASAPTASPPSSLSFDPREFEMVDVQPSEVEFLQTLKEKRTAENKGDQLIVTYKVRVREKDCVLKVVRVLTRISQRLYQAKFVPSSKATSPSISIGPNIKPT